MLCEENGLVLLPPETHLGELIDLLRNFGGSVTSPKKDCASRNRRKRRQQQTDNLRNNEEKREGSEDVLFSVPSFFPAIPLASPFFQLDRNAAALENLRVELTKLPSFRMVFNNFVEDRSKRETLLYVEPSYEVCNTKSCFFPNVL